MIVQNQNEVQMSIRLKPGIAKFPIGKSVHLDIPELKDYVEKTPGLSIVKDASSSKPAEKEVPKEVEKSETKKSDVEEVVTEEVEKPKKKRKKRK